MDNRQWLINGNPKGRPLEASDFKLETSSLGSLAAESARVRVEYLSFDPCLLYTSPSPRDRG